MQLISQLNHLGRGLSVTEETLATDIIQQVGPGGSFLDNDHTLAHYRRELWFPQYNFRGPWNLWVDSGRKGPVELAHDQVKQILAAKMEPVLSADCVQAMNKVLQQAEEDMLGTTTGFLP